MQTDGQTYMTKLIVVFGNLQTHIKIDLNATNSGWRFDLCLTCIINVGE